MFKSINNGILPTRGSEHSACVDLYANKDIWIDSGQTMLIPLGIAIDEELLFKSYKTNDSYFQKLAINDYESFLKSHYLQLMLRSSLSKQLIIANGVGVIDLDYRDEIMIRVHNPASMPTKEIYKKDKIAQITLLQHLGFIFNIHTTKKRGGGFGSTDK